MDMSTKIAVSYIKEGKEVEKDKVFDFLDTWASVDYFDPEKEHPEFEEESFRIYDLYHMAKTRNESLEDLRRAENNGVRTINPYSAAKLVDDRYNSIKILEKKGIKVPKTEYGRFEEISLDLPLVSKERFEGDGHDIELIKEPYEGEKFVQEFINYDDSFKLYKVGENVRSVRLSCRGFFDRDYVSSVEIGVEKYFEKLVDDIFEATGLNLFEADILKSHEGLYVVDVNSMVGLQNIKDGVEIYNDLLMKESGYSKKHFFPKKRI